MNQWCYIGSASIFLFIGNQVFEQQVETKQYPLVSTHSQTPTISCKLLLTSLLQLLFNAFLPTPENHGGLRYIRWHLFYAFYHNLLTSIGWACTDLTYFVSLCSPLIVSMSSHHCTHYSDLLRKQSDGFEPIQEWVACLQAWVSYHSSSKFPLILHLTSWFLSFPFSLFDSAHRPSDFTFTSFLGSKFQHRYPYASYLLHFALCSKYWL